MQDEKHLAEQSGNHCPVATSTSMKKENSEINAFIYMRNGGL